MNAALRIASVRARQVLDSRGAPTVEADVFLDGGAWGRAAVPSGASTGTHEAYELRDRDDPAWARRGVARAVANVAGVFAPAVVGLDARDQAAVDAALHVADMNASDVVAPGSPAFRRLGANAALAVSLAAAQAATSALARPFYRHIAALVGGDPLLPLPMVNMVSGGAHAGRNLDIQDVLVMPVGAPTYKAGLEMVVRVYWELRALLVEAGRPPLVGDEGGFGPTLDQNEEALALVARAIDRAGLRPGVDMALALDVAATEFYRDGAYHLEHEGLRQRTLDASDMVALVEGWAARYPLVSIEDALAEDDWGGWRLLTERLGPRLQLVGDDLFTTNVARLTQGITQGAANAVLVKVNQIGTLTDTLAALRVAREGGYRAVVSARSGETEDEWLADIAVGSGAGQIKVGSVARSERLAKYNRLLRIEEELGPDLVAAYAGGGAWGPGNGERPLVGR